ncbi:MAG TPA: hypothetical protein PK095_25760, partial [Myxococcota bacterium]|nr:hypothetical protein [Myxococcota bacterium]
IPSKAAFTASRRQALYGLDGVPLDKLDTPHVVKGLAFLPAAPACEDPGGPAHLATAGVDYRLRLLGPPPFETQIHKRSVSTDPLVRRLAPVRTHVRGPCEWMALALTDYGALELFDRSGTLLWESPGDVRGLDLAASGDGLLAVASLGSQMQAFVIMADPSPQLQAVPGLVGCGAVAVAPSAEELIACAAGPEVAIAGLDGHLVASLPAFGPSGPLGRSATREHLTDLSWSPDGRLLAVGTRLGRTLIWAAPSRGKRAEILAIMSDHRERVAALAWDPSSRWLVTGSWDRMIRPRDLGLLDMSAAGLRQHLLPLLAYRERP